MLELCGDDVDDPLGQPQVLHPRVATVRRDGRLVRHRLRELDADVAPAVHPRRDLRPDDAAERLVAEVRARVVDRLRAEAEHRAVGLDRDLGVEEPALVPVRHRLVEVGPPLRPLDRPVELPREQAARDELRVGRDLVAEAAADVLGDDAQLVGADAHRRRHHDHREPGELVVRRDRPLAGAAVELDERAVELERGRVEAVEVELGDRHDVVGLGERRVDVSPLPDARVGHVAAAFLVEDGRAVLERLPGVDDDVERLVVDHRRAPRRRGRAPVSRRRPRRPAHRCSAPCRRRARSPSRSLPARRRSGRTGRSGSRPRRPSASRTRRAARARR